MLEVTESTKYSLGHYKHNPSAVLGCTNWGRKAPQAGSPGVATVHEVQKCICCAVKQPRCGGIARCKHWVLTAGDVIKPTETARGN